MSHTIPQAHIDTTEPYRCYVHFYYAGKRQRIYNGGPIGESCNPNHQKKLADRRRELARLVKLVTQALDGGWYPGKVDKPVPEPVVLGPTAVETITEVQSRFARNGWSRTYKRDMERIAQELIRFLDTFYPGCRLDTIPAVSMVRFLDNYRSSGRYYMNKRRNLSALVTLLGIDPNPVAQTPTMRVTEQLNEAYKPHELGPVLAHLLAHSPNLYLCALLVYGTLLRPHEEIRLLRRGDFDTGLDFITLPGKKTKNGKVRRVPVPDYVKTVLNTRFIDRLKPEHYLFSLRDEPVNPDYFRTLWSRAKADLLRLGLVRPEQTLYSFRHSAAIYIWEKTQNLKLLQGLMDHGSPDVTLKYLRSLGMMEASSADDLPKLPGL